MYSKLLALVLSLGMSASPIQVKCSAYSPLTNESGICADSTPTVTSTGTRPSYGTIAVDARKIPYGTLLYVEGYGLGVASDTGGALRRYKGTQIDLCMQSHDEAVQWGVKYMTVYVIKGVVK